MKRSSLILSLLATTFVVDGVMAPLLTPKQEGGVALLHGLFIAVTCYFWCRADAEERGTIAPSRSALWAGLFPLAGIPVYFFRTRPAGRAALSTLKAFAVVAAFFLADAGIAEGIRALRT